MSIFHTHQWTEVNRKVVIGALEAGRGFKSGGSMGQEALDSLYGYTLIESRCSTCGRTRIDRFTGASA